MRSINLAAVLVAVFTAPMSLVADQALLETHCADCHGGADPEGDFALSALASHPHEASIGLWVTALEHLKAGDMPPPEDSQLSPADRRRLTRFLTENVRNYDEQARSFRVAPRRLNNRELVNSVSDVLLIEDPGTHQPTGNLLGDTLQDGFDTNGDALGLSQFHLEQYIDAFRSIVDATILTGEQPVARFYDVSASDLRMTSLSQRRRERGNVEREYRDILDPRLHIYFSNFETAPATGRYRITIRAAGIDREVYDPDATGVYHDDPIRMSVHLGARVRTFDLPDNEVMEIELDEWIAAGTRLELSYPTDGLRMQGNGNFKFQYRIAHDYIKENDPDRYARVVEEQLPKAPGRTARNPSHWSHWVGEWEGPRPRVFSAAVEGPFYDSWPPRRQMALLGADPQIGNAAEILRPIAERAWRRTVHKDELGAIVRLVESRAEQLGEVGALREGIVAILVSPSFLLINPGEGEAADRFSTKLSYFLRSTSPDESLRESARSGRMATFEAVRDEVQRRFDQSSADEFLLEFPQAWLQLDRINFMAPDPDRFPLYDRKRLSDDMIGEVRHFFRHAIENNVPVPELISADYTFLNADLARVYGVDDVPQDSQLRRYTFTDGRRGGLLGMGAFLTLTADSLSTSPIHRAVYVMENFMGIHPAPPPDDVRIEEPDVRQARTIKEILDAHRAEAICASCHRSIDPYGFAFENFDAVGAWRDNYTEHIAPNPSRDARLEIEQQDRQRVAQGLPLLPKPWENQPIPVDAAARFRNGAEYDDIVQFREHLLTETNRDRFVRCFITKLLTYANGVEPENYSEVESILSRSAENDYRIVDTIAAVVDSPLFREE